MSDKIITGKVVSTKMNKTVVVEIELSKIHPVYGRRFKMHTKLKAHYEGSELNVGDVVLIKEIAPVSKSKTWMVIPKDKKEVKETKE